jgi:hypothetical protein
MDEAQQQLTFLLDFLLTGNLANPKSSPSLEDSSSPRDTDHENSRRS